MPKIKRGRRHHFSSSRQKHYERTWQAHGNKLNVLMDITNHSHAIPSLEQLNVPSVMSQFSQWHSMQTSDYVELSLLQGSAPGIVKFSITINKSLGWSVRVYGRLVPDYNELYDDFPSKVTSVGVISTLCNSIEKMYVCEGNSDDEFVSMINNKGGVIKNGDVVSAYYNENSGSIHHSKCLLLRKEVGKCSSCQQYRASLRAMKSRQKFIQSDLKMSHNSRTNYRYLDKHELEARLQSAQAAKRTLKRTVMRLTDKLNSLIDRDGMELVEEDEAEMKDLIEEVDEAAKARSHFQKIFWQQQRTYNSLGNKRRMRWHPLMIRFALNLKFLSSNAYRAVGNFLALPSNRTLCDYTHIISEESGVSYSLIERMKKEMHFERCESTEKIVGIMLDEMKIRSGLVFNRRSDRIVGFVNLGDVNSDSPGENLRT